jgi:DNA-binding transcriptional ArsR family regulator
MSLDRVIAGTQAVVPVRRTKASVALPATLDGRTERLAQLFKAMGHEGRLAILSHLAEGERSVTALELLLGQRQAAVSQQLARLRLEGLVSTRREGKTIFYAIQDPRVIDLLRSLPGLGA